MRSRIVLLAAALVALAPLVALAADPAVKQFKSDWDFAQSYADREKRKDAELKALEHLKNPSSVEAAQAALAVALEANAAFESHEAAVSLLKEASAEPVHAWGVKELGASKDARARAILAGIVGSWKDGWKAVVAALKDKEPPVIEAAADALSRVKEKDVVAALVRAIKDAKEPRVQDDLGRALRALTGQSFKDAAEWESWWSSAAATFSFDAPAEPPKPAEEPAAGGVPKTTSNGSGLYETISSNKVIFVIDTSYSMRITGEVAESASDKKKTCSRLQFVQNELVAAIEGQLTKKCFFNVIAYSTKVTPWKAKLVEATDANKKAAKAWVAALQPDDETNTYDALEAAFADKQVDTIYLLTDGYPTKGKVTNPDTIRGEIRKWNDSRRIRINCICYVVGDGTKFSVAENKDMSKNFMQALAKENGGFCKVFE